MSEVRLSLALALHFAAQLAGGSKLHASQLIDPGGKSAADPPGHAIALLERGRVTAIRECQEYEICRAVVTVSLSRGEIPGQSPTGSLHSDTEA
jgi:hypothetical protein